VFSLPIANTNGLPVSGLQAATILVAMASGENFWRPKFLAKVASWQPADYKRNLLEKLSILGLI